MKKIFNYRPLVSICLFLMAGIVCVVGLYISSAVWLVASAFMIALLLTTFFVKLFLAKSQKVFKLVSIFVAFLVGSISSVCVIESYKARPNISGDYYVVGRVSERAYRSSNERIVITLDNVSVVNLETTEALNLGGKVRIYLASGDERCLGFDLGSEVRTVATLRRVNLFSSNVSSSLSNITKGIYVSGNGYEDDVSLFGEADPNIFQLLKNKVKLVLEKNMSPEYSELAYAMLFGDKAGLNDEMESNFYNSGIGHILAVNGLHVGFLVALIGFVLSLFKANNKVKFYVISIVVFLYAFLCGFSTSITRAMIMTMVLLYSRARYREYDGLSSLALAGIIILMFSPLQLFTLGFLLSFGAVASIILLCRPLEVFFEKFFFKRFASALALTISATVGTLPFTIIFLKKLSLFSVVTNIVAIPIVSVAFMVLVPTTLLSLAFGFFGVLTKGFELLMRVVAGISQLTGAINLAGANGILIALMGASIIALCICASDYVFSGKKLKAITCTSLGVASAVLFIVSLVL